MAEAARGTELHMEWHAAHAVSYACPSGGGVVEIDGDALGRVSPGCRAFVRALVAGTTSPENAGHQVESLEDAAVCWDGGGEGVWFVRGSSTRLPLYFTWRGSGLLVTNDLSTAAGGEETRADLFAFYAAEAVRGPYEIHSTHETPYTGVFRAPRGSVTRVDLRDRSIRRWHITHDDRGSLPDDPALLRARLRDLLRARLESDCSEHDTVAFEVSGGIDSTVVAATACTVLPRATRRHGISILYPYYEFRRERRHIDEAYRATGMRPMFLDGNSMLPLDAQEPLPTHSEPDLSIVGVRQHAGVLAAARSVGATLLLNGFGGDTIFGMGPTGQFRMPAPPPRPAWASSAFWSRVEEHSTRLATFLCGSPEVSRRIFFSGEFVDDRWADRHIEGTYGVRRRCVFRDAEVLRIAARLWEAGAARGPYKRILRETFASELPESIRTRPHKCAYDGLYVRGYRRHQARMEALIDRHAERLDAEGIEIRALRRAIGRIAAGDLAGDQMVSALLSILFWLDQPRRGADGG